MKEFQVYKALGDPIRLEIVKRLTFADPLVNLTELTTNLGISRQGARKQIQVLVDLGVVKLHREAREVFVELDTHSLTKARNYLAKLESQWEVRLNKLRALLEDDK